MMLKPITNIRLLLNVPFYRTFSSLQKETDQLINIKTLSKLTKKETITEVRQKIEPIPKSPCLGPIKIDNPKVSFKTFRWCACGLSKTQPLCDDSHKGTAFKPFRFTLEQKCESIELCGCKLTQNKPFCDGKTCVELRKN